MGWHPDMEKIRATSPLFQGFRQFALHSFLQGKTFSDAVAVDEFLNDLRADINKALSKENMLFGLRTEVMFEYLVAGLGKVALLKQEDGAECYARDGSALEIPDFRIVLEDSRQILVEVKNLHHSNPTKALTLKADYLDGLCKYATLTKSELFIAIYWSRWRLWTLNKPDAFTRQGGAAELPFLESHKSSHMALLGDCAIGTRWPLRFVMFLEELNSTKVSDSERTISVKIEAVKMFCEEDEITDPTEKTIAWFLMLYGNWKETEHTHSDEEGRLYAVEYRFEPEEVPVGQNVHIAGNLSTMFVRSFLSATSDRDSKSVRQFHMKSKPGALGRLIPEGYKGKALPLWILYLVAENVDDVGKEVENDGNH